MTTPGTLVTVKGVGDCPGGGVGKPMGPGVGAHCGTLQQIGSWGSTTSVQPAGTGLYTLHLQREDVHLAPAKGTRDNLTAVHFRTIQLTNVFFLQLFAEFIWARLSRLTGSESTVGTGKPLSLTTLV